MFEPGAIVERYRVVKTLGQGGMAAVYLVEHTALNTRFALKVLQMTGPQLRQRFLEEGRTQSRVRHPNLVQVYDVIELPESGLPALVLEYVDGPDLLQWITRELPGPALAEEVFRGILAGVRAAHELGVVHRDLKPANVMMARDADGKWLPKVADFGLAKAVSSSSDDRGFSTRQGVPMGTPRYMAPEQIRDASAADFRSDVFALGVILYELLAHEPAYDGPDVMEIFKAVTEGRRRTLPPTVPAHLVSAVDSCLSLSPLDRPVSVDAVVSLLDAGQPRVSTAAATTLRVGVAVLGAWVVVLAGATVVLVIVALALFSRMGDDPQAPCAPADHVLGVVRAPTVFTRKAGDAWLLRQPTQVYSVGDDGAGIAPVCVLGMGHRLTLVEEPIVVGGDRWVRVDGAGLVPPVPGDPDLGGDRGPCEGEPGAFVGYVRARGRGFLGAGTPREGGTWNAAEGAEIYAFVGAEGEQPPVVCVIDQTHRFDVVGEPEKVGREWWIPYALPTP